jgi:hypothetical protein
LLPDGSLVDWWLTCCVFVVAGKLLGRIHDSRDKVAALKRVKSEYPGSFVVYVGDGIVDIPALLEADQGILLQTKSSYEPSSLQVLEALRIGYEPAKVIHDTLNNDKIPSSRIVVVSDWEEIEAALERLGVVEARTSAPQGV